jgi:hypothetical protein
MPGEFIARQGLISRGNVVVTGSLTTSGSLTTTGTITATTLVVQTITSSISSITGSTNFGSLSSNTHTFTGSLNVTGALAVTTNGVEFQVNSTGVNLGNALTDSHIISGSLRVNPNGLFVSGSGFVGINTSSSYSRLDVRGGAVSQTTTDFAVGSAGTVVYMRTGATTGNTTFGLIQVGNTGDNVGGNLVLNQFGGNVGIGTSSPMPWSGSFLGLSVGQTSVGCLPNSANAYFTNNLYYDGSSWRRGIAAPVAILQMNEDVITIQNAGTGTAGSVATMNERMRIYSGGGVVINASSTNQTLTTGDAGVTRTNTYFGTGQVRIGGGSDHGSSTVLSVAPGVVTFDRPGVGGGALTINSSGYVTKPSQPSFYATSTAGATTYGSSEVIVFNTTRHNIGSCYNTSNGRFTAPVAGRYLFSLNVYNYGSYSNGITLTINGSQYAVTDVQPFSFAASDVGGSISTGFTLVWELAVNDYVEVRVRSGGSANIYRAHSHFSGQLLS